MEVDLPLGSTERTWDSKKRETTLGLCSRLGSETGRVTELYPFTSRCLSETALAGEPIEYPSGTHSHFSRSPRPVFGQGALIGVSVR